jgi:hypothetical protein
MSTPSRKRKQGLRQPNGRLRKPSKADREAFAKRMEEVEMQTVLAQPHRLGDRDQQCECALGRFFKRNRHLRRELRDAAEHYRETKRRWRAAWGAPTVDRIETGGGEGPSDKTVKAWGREIDEMERAAARVAPFAILPFQWLTLQNEDRSLIFDPVIIAVMEAVAISLGLLDSRRLTV